MVRPGRIIPHIYILNVELLKTGPQVLAEKLANFGTTPDEVKHFVANADGAEGSLGEILGDLKGRGLGGFVKLDLSIVRGLAYYTGVVFEIFDAKKSMRAVAGGGRYDSLVKTISDGAVDLPATGFAMGE